MVLTATLCLVAAVISEIQVVSITPSNDKRSASVVLQNTGEKPISAFTFQVEEVGENDERSISALQLIDSLPGAISPNSLSFRRPLIAPGEAKNFEVSLSGKQNSADLRIEGIVFNSKDFKGSPEAQSLITHHRNSYIIGCSMIGGVLSGSNTVEDIPWRIKWIATLRGVLKKDPTLYSRSDFSNVAMDEFVNSFLGSLQSLEQRQALEPKPILELELNTLASSPRLSCAEVHRHDLDAGK